MRIPEIVWRNLLYFFNFAYLQILPGLSDYYVLYAVDSTEEELLFTLQSSKTNSQVLDPLIPSLSSFCAVVNPGKPFSIRNADIPCCGLLVDMSVLAYT